MHYVCNTDFSWIIHGVLLKRISFLWRNIEINIQNKVVGHENPIVSEKNSICPHADWGQLI